MEYSICSYNCWQLVHTKKPTGNTECPSKIEHTHAIEYTMNEKAGSRALDDEEHR